MGYEIYLSRDRDLDGDNSHISLQEWQTFVASDPEIIPDPDNPSSTNYLFVSAEESHPIWYSHAGFVHTKYPSEHVIAKMLQIGDSLNARVTGDDQEIYFRDTNGQINCVS